MLKRVKVPPIRWSMPLRVVIVSKLKATKFPISNHDMVKLKLIMNMKEWKTK